MSDPTYGRIDPDIQALVDELLGPDAGIGKRVALENTIQSRRDAGRYEDGPLRPPYDVISEDVVRCVPGLLANRPSEGPPLVAVLAVASLLGTAAYALARWLG